MTKLCQFKVSKSSVLKTLQSKYFFLCIKKFIFA